MGRNRHLLRTLAVAIVGTVLAGCSTSIEMQPPTVTATTVKGTAQYSTNSTNWQALKPGQTLVNRCVIKTSEKGTVEILLGEEYKPVVVPDNSLSAVYAPRTDFEDRIKILAGTEVSIDKLTCKRIGSWFDGWTDVYEVEMNLRSGNLVGTARMRPKSSRQLLQFGQYSICVEGGLYGVFLNRHVAVYRGHAVVSDGKEQVVIPPNELYDVTTKTMETNQLGFAPVDVVPINNSVLTPFPAKPIYREPITPQPKK